MSVPPAHRRTGGGYCAADREDWPCPFVQGRTSMLRDVAAAIDGLRVRHMAPHGRSRTGGVVLVEELVRRIDGLEA